MAQLRSKRTLIMVAVGYIAVLLIVTYLNSDRSESDERSQRVTESPSYGHDFYGTRPVSLEDNVTWIAVRTEQTERVIKILRLLDVQPIDWQTGLSMAHSPVLSATLFVTDPIDGWTIILGDELPQAADPDNPHWMATILFELAQQYDDVCYFAAESDRRYFSWARVNDGELVHALTMDKGILRWNVGTRIKEEQDATVDAELVMRLAAEWSIDLSSLPTDNAEGYSGYVGRITARWVADDPWEVPSEEREKAVIE